VADSELLVHVPIQAGLGWAVTERHECATSGMLGGGRWCGICNERRAVPDMGAACRRLLSALVQTGLDRAA
jgi:hypothetical protein